MWKRNLGRGEFGRFPNLSTVWWRLTYQLLVLECFPFWLLSTTWRYFKMNLPYRILDPFSSTNAELSPKLQEELIYVKANEELKFKYKDNYQQFWLQKQIPTFYPGLWALIQKLIAFPWSYLVEREFSVVTNLLTKERTRLQIASRGD